MTETKEKAAVAKWKAVLLASSLGWGVVGFLILVVSLSIVSAANLPPLALFLAICVHIWAVRHGGILGPEALTVVGWIVLTAVAIFAIS